MKKFKSLLNVVLWILSFFMFLTVIAFAALTLKGYKFYSVQTGSMEPTYPVGSLVIVQPVDFDDLHDGDVITFKSGGAVITHRITLIESENRSIHTKGDNNNVEDSAPVQYENVVGRVVYGVSRLGYLVLFAKTKLGIIVYTSIIVLIFLARLVADCFEEDDGEDEEGETA